MLCILGVLVAVAGVRIRNLSVGSSTTGIMVMKNLNGTALLVPDQSQQTVLISDIVHMDVISSAGPFAVGQRLDFVVGIVVVVVPHEDNLGLGGLALRKLDLDGGGLLGLPLQDVHDGPGLRLGLGDNDAGKGGAYHRSFHEYDVGALDGWSGNVRDPQLLLGLLGFLRGGEEVDVSLVLDFRGVVQS